MEPPPSPPPRQRRRTTAAAEEEPRTPTTIHDVPDDLLRRILLRLNSPLWLIRAASASRPLRRAIIAGGRAFLRLAASLHAPVIIGYYHDRSISPIAFTPSSSPSRPPIDGVRFFLDFLPRDVTTTTAYWKVSDCHGGLLLLRGRFSISISNFRVLYRFQKAPYVCVFSITGGGGAGSWRFLRESADGGGYSKYMGNIAGRVDGSLYLGFPAGNVKVLDNVSLELSEVDLPIGINTWRHPNRSAFTVVHGAGSNPTSPATTRIVHVNGDGLEVFRLVRGSGGEYWVLEHSIAKRSEAARGLLGYHPDKELEWTEVSVTSVGNGIAVVSARDRDDRKCLFYFDVDTKEAKVVLVPNEDYRRTRRTFAYALPWRQFLRANIC